MPLNNCQHPYNAFTQYLVGGCVFVLAGDVHATTWFPAKHSPLLQPHVNPHVLPRVRYVPVPPELITLPSLLGMFPTNNSQVLMPVSYPPALPLPSPLPVQSVSVRSQLSWKLHLLNNACSPLQMLSVNSESGELSSPSHSQTIISHQTIQHWHNPSIYTNSLHTNFCLFVVVKCGSFSIFIIDICYYKDYV